MLPTQWIDFLPIFGNLSTMITPEQIRMAKTALGWSNNDLAQLAGRHKNTINNAGNGKAKESTFLLLKILFEKGKDTYCVEFIPQNGGSPGIRLNNKYKLTIFYSRVGY